MFGDLDWPLNAWRGLSAIAEFLVVFLLILSIVCHLWWNKDVYIMRLKSLLSPVSASEVTTVWHYRNSIIIIIIIIIISVSAAACGVMRSAPLCSISRCGPRERATASRLMWRWSRLIRAHSSSSSSRSNISSSALVLSRHHSNTLSVSVSASSSLSAQQATHR